MLVGDQVIGLEAELVAEDQVVELAADLLVVVGIHEVAPVEEEEYHEQREYSELESFLPYLG